MVSEKSPVPEKSRKICYRPDSVIDKTQIDPKPHVKIESDKENRVSN